MERKYPVMNGDDICIEAFQHQLKRLKYFLFYVILFYFQNFSLSEDVI